MVSYTMGGRFRSCNLSSAFLFVRKSSSLASSSSSACNMLQHETTHGKHRDHTAAYFDTHMLQHSATFSSTVRHVAHTYMVFGQARPLFTHRNTLQQVVQQTCCFLERICGAQIE